MMRSNFDWRSHAPRTEGVWDGCDQAELEMISAVDLRELGRRGSVEDPARSTFSIRGRMRSWELMIGKLLADWPPHGYYLIDEYINDLSLRTGLNAMLDQLPPSLSVRIWEALHALDGDLWAGTRPDSSCELLQHYSPSQDLSGLAWWWHRVPTVCPWLQRDGG